MTYANPKRTSYQGQRIGKRFALNRTFLPSPLDYYVGREQMCLTGAGEWLSTCCPFHDDNQLSLRINIKGGGYKCMACEAKGGDIIAFHMAQHSMPFIEACKSLGAWEEGR